MAALATPRVTTTELTSNRTTRIALAAPKSSVSPTAAAAAAANDQPCRTTSEATTDPDSPYRDGHRGDDGHAEEHQRRLPGEDPLQEVAGRHVGQGEEDQPHDHPQRHEAVPLGEVGRAGTEPGRRGHRVGHRLSLGRRHGKPP
jgi:hypothetical protein